jgi:hypothetical protein
MIEIIKELIQFIRVRRKYWLIPILFFSVLLGGLVVLTQGTAVTPFIYTIF